MQKKSQVTLFVVLGIVIVVVIALLFYARIAARKSVAEEDISFSAQVDNVKNYVGGCLRYTLISGKGYYLVMDQTTVAGIKMQLEYYIDNNLKECTGDFDIFNLEIEDYDVESEVTLKGDDVNNLDIIAANVRYPVTIKKGERKAVLEEFYADYSLVY